MAAALYTGKIPSCLDPEFQNRPFQQLCDTGQSSWVPLTGGIISKQTSTTTLSMHLKGTHMQTA